MEINDWKIAGGGIQGCNYFSESHPNLVLKVYASHFSKAYVEREFENSTAFKNLGFSCPESYEILKYNDGYGIISQRIHHKKSFCTLSSEHPEMMPLLAKRMADMIKKVHAASTEGTPFNSFLGVFQALLDNNIWLDDRMKSLFQKTIDELAPIDRKTVIHGDFHFGNIITDGQNDYFIDLGSLSYGHPNFDLAMFYLTTHFGSDEMSQDTFHLSRKQTLEFWNLFKIAYYGEDIPDRELFATYKKYIFLRTLWIQSDMQNSEFSRSMINLFADENCPHTV